MYYLAVIIRTRPAPTLFMSQKLSSDHFLAIRNLLTVMNTAFVRADPFLLGLCVPVGKRVNICLFCKNVRKSTECIRFSE